MKGEGEDGSGKRRRCAVGIFNYLGSAQTMHNSMINCQQHDTSRIGKAKHGTDNNPQYPICIK